MELHRRQFIQSSIALALGAGLARSVLARGPVDEPKQTKDDGFITDQAVKQADKPLRVLFLGGTMFLGPAAVEWAVARGHTVTLFNRGKSNPEMFPNLEKIRGDRRKGEIEALGGKREWDVVIDTNAYVPKEMRQMQEILKGRVGHYVMVATANVYSDETKAGQDETAPVWNEWPDEAEVSEKTYGPMKRGCEVEVEKAMPGHCVSVRPSLICGPRDPTDRFTYWPLRCKRGGEILAPVGPDEPVQFVDVRDLGRFLVLACEKRLTGAYNACGPARMKLAALLEACIAAARPETPARLSWAPLKFLNDNKVESWSDMPVWIPSADPEQAGSNLRVGTKAFREGMTARTMVETAKGALDWWPREVERRTRITRERIALAEKEGREKPQLPDPTKLRAGLTAEREGELLKTLAAGTGQQKQRAG